MDERSTSARPRRAARPPRRRLAAGHVVMLVAGLLGVLLTLTVVRRADDTVAVLVAGRDLAPGERLAAADVRVAHVDAEPGFLAQLVPPGDPVDGAVVTHPVAAGAPILASALSEPAAAGVARTMSFPVARARAVSGALAPGDRIDVVAADPDAGGAWYVASALEVVAVSGGGGGPLDGAGDEVTVTVALDADAALALAAALASNDVTLVRSTGAAAVPPATAEPPPAPSAPAGGPTAVPGAPIAPSTVSGGRGEERTDA